MKLPVIIIARLIREPGNRMEAESLLRLAAFFMSRKDLAEIRAEHEGLLRSMEISGWIYLHNGFYYLNMVPLVSHLNTLALTA